MTQTTLTLIATFSATIVYLTMWIENKKIINRQALTKQLSKKELPSFVYPTPTCKKYCPLMQAIATT